jgi:hypothetical protein
MIRLSYRSLNNVTIVKSKKVMLGPTYISNWGDKKCIRIIWKMAAWKAKMQR